MDLLLSLHRILDDKIALISRTLAGELITFASVELTFTSVSTTVTAYKFVFTNYNMISNKAIISFIGFI